MAQRAVALLETVHARPGLTRAACLRWGSSERMARLPAATTALDELVWWARATMAAKAAEGVKA